MRKKKVWKIGDIAYINGTPIKVKIAEEDTGQAYILIEYMVKLYRKKEIIFVGYQEKKYRCILYPTNHRGKRLCYQWCKEEKR